MEAMPVAERMSAEEFLALPVTDRTRFASLVEGEVVVNDPCLCTTTSRRISSSLCRPGRGPSPAGGGR